MPSLQLKKYKALRMSQQTQASLEVENNYIFIYSAQSVSENAIKALKNQVFLLHPKVKFSRSVPFFLSSYVTTQQKRLCPSFLQGTVVVCTSPTLEQGAQTNTQFEQAGWILLGGAALKTIQVDSSKESHLLRWYSCYDLMAAWKIPSQLRIVSTLLTTLYKAYPTHPMHYLQKELNETLT